MNSFEMDNYEEPQMMVAKKQEEDNPLCSFTLKKKTSRKKVKMIKLLRKK
jgi:hypothetical protein